jgi:hypothetical protein
MALVIDFTVEINASPATVWGVLTDLPRYGEWNPFVEACSSTLIVGEPIEMKVRIFSAFAQQQRETILAHESGTLLTYGIAPLPLDLLSSSRSHVISSLDGGRTLYESRFRLGGRLSGLVSMMMGAKLRAGFSAMTNAVVVRAEALAPLG